MEKTPVRHNDVLNHQTASTSGSSVGKAMSTALKNRLKRARSSFISPLNVVKRLKIDEDELPQTSNKEMSQCEEEEGELDVNRNETLKDHVDCVKRLGSDLSQDSEVRSDLIQLRDQLRKDVKLKSETLRRLKMVKMYRKKNDLTQLQGLIDKWRQCVQAVLYELQTELPSDGRKISLSQLIDHFGLEDKILHFSRTEEDFTDS